MTLLLAALLAQDVFLVKPYLQLGDNARDASRLALLWRYWEKCSAAEMARRAGKTEKAIERLLMRARDQFRRRW